MKRRVLIACEMSGIVREAFRRRGFAAWSCDLLPSEIPSKYHIRGDVRKILNDGWRLIIAHPPCTYLSVSGLHWNKYRPERAALTEKALKFVWEIWTADAELICLENPISCISTRFDLKPQVIQPNQFGHDASKATCLFKKNLPDLCPTQHVAPRIVNGKKRWANQTDSGQNRLGPSPTRAADRGRTYTGIADAFALQFGARV